jgi:hypothetical protein
MLMKRIYNLLFAGLIFGILVAPFGIVWGANGASVSGNVVLAATPVTIANNFLPAPSCVKIAIPLLKGGSTCVANDAGSGGAIVNYLRDVLSLLGGIVGLVVMIMLVIAGLQYITSAGDPAMVKSAKSHIVNAITALVLYLMMVAILQFLIPGGIL